MGRRDRGDKLPVCERWIVVGGVKSLGASFPGTNFCSWFGILLGGTTLLDVKETVEELQVGLGVRGVGSRGVGSWSPGSPYSIIS